MKNVIIIFAATILLYSCNQKLKPAQTTAAPKPRPKVYVVSKELEVTHTALDSFPGSHHRKLQKWPDTMQMKLLAQP